MKYSLESPKPGGTFAAASAAFVRLHERRVEEETLKDWEKRERAAGNWWGTHGASRVELEEGQTHRAVEQWVPRAQLLTKYKALMADLQALREEEPNMRVVVFTEYDEVQERLVDMLRSEATGPSGGSGATSAAGSRAGSGSAGSRSYRSSRLAARAASAAPDGEPDGASGSPAGSPDGAAGASGSPERAPDGVPLLGPDDLDGEEGGTAEATGRGAATGSAAGDKDGAAAGTGLKGLQLFEFNAKTAPVARHKRIKDFQGGGDDGAKVFVVTYRTAAVGITLTAANRVYLFEPALDPAQEVQAAGRIHRLGQTKEVNVLAL